MSVRRLHFLIPNMEQFNFPHSFRDLSGNIQSDVSLILSLVGVFHKILPLDVVWVAIVIYGILILLGTVRGLVFDHGYQGRCAGCDGACSFCCYGRSHAYHAD